MARREPRRSSIVTACGRFIDDEQRLYYTWTDVAPFGVKGPVLPVGYVEGQRFSIYEQSSCWSLEDLARTSRRAAKVWSLELHGPAFDDDVLATMPAFPRLEILELDDAAVNGSGLKGLACLPRLRHLRARLSEAEKLALHQLPIMAMLESLSISALPPVLEGVSRLGEATPKLRQLALRSKVATRADGELVARTVEHLDLELPSVPSWVAMPSALRWLSIHATDASDDDVRSILSACPASLDSLGLRGTPVSDRILHDLERFPELKYVDAVDTRITKPALKHFAERRGPDFKCYPTL